MNEKIDFYGNADRHFRIISHEMNAYFIFKVQRSRSLFGRHLWWVTLSESNTFTAAQRILKGLMK